MPKQPVEHRSNYRGDRDQLLCRPPEWLGTAIRAEADERGIPYNDVMVEILAPAFEAKRPEIQPRPQQEEFLLKTG